MENNNEFLDSRNNPAKILTDSTLSIAARLIFALYLNGALKDIINITELEIILDISQNTRRTALRELEKTGICNLIKTRNEQGHVVGSYWKFTGKIATTCTNKQDVTESATRPTVGQMQCRLLINENKTLHKTCLTSSIKTIS